MCPVEKSKTTAWMEEINKLECTNISKIFIHERERVSQQQLNDYDTLTKLEWWREAREMRARVRRGANMKSNEFTCCRLFWFGMKGSMRIYCTRQQARHVWGGGENEWNNWQNLNSAFVCDVIRAESFDKVKINFHTLAVCRPSLAISWSRLSKIYMFKHCSRDSRKRERELNISKANDSTTNHSKEKCQDQADPFQFTHKTFLAWEASEDSTTKYKNERQLVSHPSRALNEVTKKGFDQKNIKSTNKQRLRRGRESDELMTSKVKHLVVLKTISSHMLLLGLP